MLNFSFFVANNMHLGSILGPGVYQDIRINGNYYKITGTNTIKKCSSLCKSQRKCTASMVFYEGYNCFIFL